MMRGCWLPGLRVSLGCAFALFAVQAPGCTATETGNPSTVMGFALASRTTTDDAPEIFSASLSLTAIDLLDCAPDPGLVASPEPPLTIDLVEGNSTTTWTATEADVCRCDLDQMDLSVAFVDAEGVPAKLVLRGDALVRLRSADEPYRLLAGEQSIVGYDLAAWLASLDLASLLPEDGVRVVDGETEPEALRRLVEQLEPFVALYPDRNADGVLDEDERQSPLAVGQP